ncbi:MAG: phosphoribosylglycinamide formyltransferase [Clostridia bacterium]|nr:phosphoribosylglycinamide formyltransferase [Clostridia bacterium]
MIKIAVLVSGGGTNLQALIDAERQGVIRSGTLSLVVSNNANAYAVERAKAAGIESRVLLKRDFPSQEAFEDALINTLKEKGIEFVVLAGFMSILGKRFIDAYEGRIINVHPALIPSFCGKGYYGLRVHEEALKKGVKVTGATVHYVNEIADGGEIIAQKAVRVLKNDTPETLQKRVMRQAEWIILPRATEMVCKKLSKTKGENV